MFKRLPQAKRLAQLVKERLPREGLKELGFRIKNLQRIEKKVKRQHSEFIEGIIRSKIAGEKEAEMDALGATYRHVTPSHQSTWPESLHPDLQKLLKHQGRPMPQRPLEAGVQPYDPLQFKGPIAGREYGDLERKVFESRAEHSQSASPKWKRKPRYPAPFDQDEARHTIVDLEQPPGRPKVKKQPLGKRKAMAPVIRPRGKMTGDQWHALSERVIQRELAPEKAAQEALQFEPPVEKTMASIEYPKKRVGREFTGMNIENLPYESAINRFAELKNLGTEGLRTRTRPPVDRFSMQQGKPVYERQVFKNIETAGTTVAEQASGIEKSSRASAITGKTKHQLEQSGGSELIKAGATAELLWRQNVKNKRSFDYNVWKRLLDKYQSRGATKDVKTYFNERVAMYFLNKDRLLKTRTGKSEVRLIEGYLKSLKEVMK